MFLLEDFGKEIYDYICPEDVDNLIKTNKRICKKFMGYILKSEILVICSRTMLRLLPPCSPRIMQLDGRLKVSFRDLENINFENVEAFQGPVDDETFLKFIPKKLLTSIKEVTSRSLSIISNDGKGQSLNVERIDEDYHELTIFKETRENFFSEISNVFIVGNEHEISLTHLKLINENSVLNDILEEIIHLVF